MLVIYLLLKPLKNVTNDDNRRDYKEISNAIENVIYKRQ